MSKSFSHLRSLIADMRRDQREHFWPLIALMTVGAVAETFGLLLLVPLIALASGELEWPVAIPFSDPLASYAVDQRLMIVSLIFVFVMAVRAGLLWMRDRRHAQIVIEYGASLRARFIAALTSRDWKRADALGESGFQQALLSDAARVSHAAEQGLGVMGAMLLLAIQGMAALILSPSLTLFALGLFALSAAIALPLLRRSSRRGEAIADAIGETSDEAGRLFQAMKGAVAEGTAGEFFKTYRERNVALASAEAGLSLRQARARAIANVFVAVGAVVLLLAGAIWFELSIAVLIPLLVIFARLSGPARQAFFSLEQMLVFAPSFASFEGAAQSPASARPSASDKVHWRTLAASGVACRVDDDLRLGPFDLTLNRCEWVGLSGPSGSGKSVLVDMVVGLIEPDEGRFELDGRPVLLTRNAGWAKGLSYVGQNALLVDGDLATNLQTDQIDDEIMRAVGLEGIVERVGLKTSLGLRGGLLSGGEAQRVALARALHRRPNLLVIDEGTAALDPDTEAQILSSIRKFVPRMAVLIVAHRRETLALADRVYTLR